MTKGNTQYSQERRIMRAFALARLYRSLERRLVRKGIIPPVTPLDGEHLGNNGK